MITTIGYLLSINEYEKKWYDFEKSNNLQLQNPDISAKMTDPNRFTYQTSDIR